MNQTPFVVGAYAAAAVILIGIIVASWLDLRRQKRLLARASETERLP